MDRNLLWFLHALKNKTPLTHIVKDALAFTGESVCPPGAFVNAPGGPFPY
jgi:hypothetical protein